jgi:Flp pilus assembly protein TadG
VFYRIPATRKKSQASKNRCGIAAVELAVVLPVLLILVLGTIEVCQRIFLRQSAVIVAYEGARFAARSTSSTADVVQRCQTLLTQRHVTDGTIVVSPVELLSTTPGTLIQVRITIPWASNSPTRFVLQDQGTVTVDAFMLRE